MSFGKAFGRLIHEKRRIEGLTQAALAELAYGEEGQKARVSELENGKVEKPRAETIDRFIVALNISDEEFNAVLNIAAHPSFIDNLADFFELAERTFVHIEIAANLEGRVFLFHSGRLKVELKRAEYFVAERQLLFLTTNGKRRPCGMRVPEQIADQIVKSKKVMLVYFNYDDTSQTEDGVTLEIKVIE